MPTGADPREFEGGEPHRSPPSARHRWRRRVIGLVLAVAGLLVTATLAVALLVDGTETPAGDAAAVVAALETPPPQADGADTSPGADVDPPAPTAPTGPRTGPRFTIASPPLAPAPAPNGISIPALDVDAPVIGLGVDPSGAMDVPDNVTDVAWYRHGPAPGDPGSAVLAAHVDLAGQGPGVFFRLGDLAPGDVVEIEHIDGSTSTWRVTARAIYDKDELPLDAIFSRSGPPTLTLITCGGGFNPSLRRYDSNVVVFAVPATPGPR